MQGPFKCEAFGGRLTRLIREPPLPMIISIMIITQASQKAGALSWLCVTWLLGADFVNLWLY